MSHTISSQSTAPGSLATTKRVLPWIETTLLVLFIVLPAFLEFFWVVTVTRIFILSLLALSFDLVWGYAGILSIGQAMFFGIAGYSIGLLGTRLGITSMLITLPLSTLLGFAAALIIAFVIILGKRPLSMIYIALGTLTSCYAAERLAKGWGFVGAANGIPSLPLMTVGSYEINEGTSFYYLALGFLMAVYLLFRFLVRSQFGLVLAAMREQETRIAFFGYKVQHFKALVFALAGAAAGLGGGLYAYHEGFVWPNLLGYTLSTQVMLYVLFGGTGTLIGPVIGVCVFEYGSLILSEHLPHIWPIVMGFVLLVVIIFRPTGFVGIFVSERERIGSFGTDPFSGTVSGPGGRNDAA